MLYFGATLKTDRGRKILIAGGDLAGAFSAFYARRFSISSDITLLFKEDNPIGNVTLYHKTKKEFPPINYPDVHLLKKERINVLSKHEITSIDVKKKRVNVWNLETGKEFYDSYDTLILAPPAKRKTPSIAGLNLKNVFTLKKREEIDEIYRVIEKEKPQNVLIHNPRTAGFEILDHLCQKNVKSTISYSTKELFRFMDQDVAREMVRLMEEKGVQFKSKSTISELSGDKKVRTAIFPGQFIRVDLVIIEGDVSPSIEHARMAGIMIGSSGAIHTGPRMETRVRSIFSAGESVEDTHFLTGKNFYPPSPSSLIRQGKVAGLNSTGYISTYRGSLMTTTIGFAGFILSHCGLSEEMADREGFTPRSSLFSIEDNVSGSRTRQVRFKIIWDAKKKTILGATLFGPPNYLKWLDMVSTAIFGGLKIGDLPSIDTSHLFGIFPFPDPFLIEEFPM